MRSFNIWNTRKRKAINIELSLRSGWEVAVIPLLLVPLTGLGDMLIRLGDIAAMVSISSYGRKGDKDSYQKALNFGNCCGNIVPALG